MKTNIAHPIVKRRIKQVKADAWQISELQMEKSYHEAGHAVAASVLGQPIKQATMDNASASAVHLAT